MSDGVDASQQAKPYFPMLLGNGSDHVLIGYSGAMGGGGSHEQWCYDQAVLTGWFKTDHRGADRRILNLIQCGYVLKHGLRASGIAGFEQTFDPGNAVLHTVARYPRATVRVQTCLTAGHRLVHRFDVSPKGGGLGNLSLQMFIKAPTYWWLAAKVPQPVGLEVKPGRSHLTFNITGHNLSEMSGVLMCDHPDARAVDTFARVPGIDVPLNGRCRFSITLELTDAIDRGFGASATKQPRRFDVDDELKRYRNDWRVFAKRSSVSLPTQLQRVYDTSLYACRAHQHPHHGGVSVGSYPLMWYCDINAFDMAFSHMAFLTANRVAEARRVLGFWQQALPKMQHLARSIGASGACTMATMNQAGDPVDILPDEPEARRHIVLDTKHFITAHASLHVWQAYRYTGDRELLSEHWDVMTQTVRFLLEHTVVERGNSAEIIRSSGPNGKERVNGKSVHHPNPTRSLLAVIEAVKSICAAADVLGRPHEPAWDRLLPKLIQGIELNRVNGIIGRNRVMTTPHADPCLAGLFDAPLDKPTFLAATRRHRSTDGYQFWEDHGYSRVPWLELHVAAGMLRLGKTDAAVAHIEQAAADTTTLGALPEGVRPDGVFWKTWYITVHGAFVHAINKLLLRRDDRDVLHVMAGPPAAWGDLSFERLRAPVGLCVSASRRGRVFETTIVNESDQPQSFAVALGPARPEMIQVAPGGSVRLKHSGPRRAGRGEVG